MSAGICGSYTTPPRTTKSRCSASVGAGPTANYSRQRQILISLLWRLGETELRRRGGSPPSGTQEQAARAGPPAFGILRIFKASCALRTREFLAVTDFRAKHVISLKILPIPIVEADQIREEVNVPKSRNRNDSGQDFSDRRTSPRLPPSAFPALKSACLSTGSDVTLINISRGGALLESNERLAPSSRVSLRVITTQGTIVLHGRILRSMISDLKDKPRYRSAVVFNREFPLEAKDASSESSQEDTITTVLRPPSPENGDVSGDPALPAYLTKDEGEEVVTLTACVLPGEPDLSEIFRINKW